MWRYGQPGQPGLEFAAPMTVVRDNEQGLVAWLAVDTPVLKLVRQDGRDLRSGSRDAFLVPRRQIESVWLHYSVLRVYQPGQRWSVWHFFMARLVPSQVGTSTSKTPTSARTAQREAAIISSTFG